MIMEKDVIKTRIEEACNSLYGENHRIIENQTHERTISSRLAHRYLEPLFPGWNVDVEYNREGNGGESKRGMSGELQVPDIIIHTRGVKAGPNLVAIQVKGYWNSEDRNIDEAKLRSLKDNKNYFLLYRLELKPDSFKFKEVN